jgi:hypothetical protein
MLHSFSIRMLKKPASVVPHPIGGWISEANPLISNWSRPRWRETPQARLYLGEERCTIRSI